METTPDVIDEAQALNRRYFDTEYGLAVWPPPSRIGLESSPEEVASFVDSRRFMNSPQRLAFYVRSRRLALGLSSERLAALAAADPNIVSKLEDGLVDVELAVVMRILVALGIHPLALPGELRA
jgi:hypothetical protein